MATKRETKHLIEQRLSGVQLDGLSLPIAGPILDRPLAAPRDVRLGDTPNGDAAILWLLPTATDEFGEKNDWAAGGTGTQAFWEFLDLAGDVPDERFVAFARRFGVLGLWEYRTVDGYKVGGVDYWVPSVIDNIMTPHRYQSFTGDEYWAIERAGLLGAMYEPIAEWRRWATWFRAVVLIGCDLRRDLPASRKNWADLGWDFAFDPERCSFAGEFSRDDALQRRYFVGVIQHLLLRWAGLVPVFRWDQTGPALSLALGGREAAYLSLRGMRARWPDNTLYPALVAQLLAVLTAGTHIAACSRCGRLHPRERKARADQPAYCPDCREIADRQRKARSAAKRRAREAGD